MATTGELTAKGPGRYTGRVAPGEDPSSELVKTDERTRRILDAAVQLAEAGGFAAVRLRDVAQTSGVALGTVYKRFRSKEDLLMGVLSHELHDLRSQLADAPVCGPTPLARVSGFFGFLTEFLCRRPNLARAVVRSAASGEKALSERLASFNAKLFALSFTALQGGPGREPSPGETVMLAALQQVWFASMCGWAGNVSDRTEVIQQVAAAATLMTYGVDRMQVLGAGRRSPLRVLMIGEARPRLQREETCVEFAAATEADPLGELIARPEIDVLEVDADALTIAAMQAWTGSGRPKLVMLLGGGIDVAARLTQYVDLVVSAAEIETEAARGFADVVYLALASGAAVRDAFDEACERVGARSFVLTTRAGADVRALSMR